MTNSNEIPTGEASYSNPYDDPLFLANSESANMSLTNTPFNGSNFLSWSRGVVLALGTKNKQGFITSAVPMPAVTSPKFPQWMRCDHMVRCWLLYSIAPSIKEGFTSCKSAKLLWTDLCERYGQSNAPLLYQLKKELKNISQENASVVEYFNKLKRHWDDIEELEELPECNCGAMDKCTCCLYKKLLEIASREKVITFLMGLIDTYENLRSNILAMDPVPPINKAYSIVQQVESQKNIINMINLHQNSSAMNSFNKSSGKQPWNVWKRDPKKLKPDDRWCPACQKKGHTIDTCFVKHPELKEKFLARFSANNASTMSADNTTSGYQGAPVRRGFTSAYQGAPEYNANAASTKGPSMDSASQAPTGALVTPVHFDPVLLTTFYNQMMQLAQAKQDSPLDYSDTSVNFAGISLAHHTPNATCTVDWIIDSGATNHMCGNSALFDKLINLQAPIRIGQPDGSLQLVTQTGNISLLNGSIILHNVLYVPAFQHNLLSVGKLLLTTGFLIQFYVHHCVIQDPLSSCPVAVCFQERGLYKLKNSTTALSLSSLQHSTLIPNPAVHNVVNKTA
ncbi:uncharacterized protein LOC141649883 [Silene latifolia]|uniref:uncharacterized protein LOC141649883 n=1 Tax=Silene latifolia TaxID=37657 RepID=UPI003D776336